MTSAQKINRVRLGDYIEPVDVRNIDNSFGVDDVRGISTSKVFIKTKADLYGVNLSSYKVVGLNNFAYVSDTSRRGEKIALAFADQNSCIVSSIYTVFRVRDENLLNPRYLMMFFNRAEFDRYSRFNSWGSARETFDWSEMCAIELELPPIDIQRKYVAVYESLLENLCNYESNLDDFVNISEIFLMKLKYKYGTTPIKNYIFLKNERNRELAILNVEGVKKDKTFIPTIANMSGIELSNYKIVRKGDFAYSNRINIGSIALKRSGCCVVSPSYTVFGVKEGLLPEYLLMWLCRENFIHYAFYYSMGTVKDELDFNELSQMPIPIPPLNIQSEAVKLSNIYFSRVEKAKYLKTLLNDICPILIRGSILEAKGEKRNAN